MVGAVLAAAPYVLNALGGLFGKKKRHIDAAEMERRFGPQAVSDRAMKLYQTILSSPYGQSLIGNAAQSGQEFQTEMNRRAAASGLSPDTGASSGASTFATSAGASAASNLEAQTKAGIYGEAFPAAQQMVANEAAMEQAAREQDNNTPTGFQKIAAAAGQVAGGLGAAGVGATAAAPNPAAVVTPGATAPIEGGFTGKEAPAPGMPNTVMPQPPPGVSGLGLPSGYTQARMDTLANPYRPITATMPRAAKTRGWFGIGRR